MSTTVSAGLKPSDSWTVLQTANISNGTLSLTLYSTYSTWISEFQITLRFRMVSTLNDSAGTIPGTKLSRHKVGSLVHLNDLRETKAREEHNIFYNSFHFQWARQHTSRYRVNVHMTRFCLLQWPNTIQNDTCPTIWRVTDLMQGQKKWRIL